jgi:hypothetical protein
MWEAGPAGAAGPAGLTQQGGRSGLMGRTYCLFADL